MRRTVVCTAWGPPQYASARVVGIPSFRFAIYPEKRFARPLPRVGRILKEFQPDLIHAVNPGFLSFSAIYYARRLGVPLIASYHTHIPTYARYYRLAWLEPLLWQCFKTIHNKADITLCPSQATLKELKRRGFRNLDVWDRGVDLQLFSPSKRSERMRSRLLKGKDFGQKILLFVGRLAQEKGIEGLRVVLEQEPGIHLAVVGDGPYRTELERIFAGTNVTFMGYLFGEELAEAYASADGFIFPSTTETLGLVLFEAMASGLPIMAADSPATREVLENGQAGLIFNSLDCQSILSTARELLFSGQTRERILKRAQEVASNLDWSGPTQQLVRHYQGLFQSRQSALVRFE